LLAGARFASGGCPRELSRRKEREVDDGGGKARGTASIFATEIDLLSGGCSRFTVQELHRHRISGRALDAWCFAQIVDGDRPVCVRRVRTLEQLQIQLLKRYVLRSPPVPQ
jgi:hypothetical protein